jgi:hypothetical protein
MAGYDFRIKITPSTVECDCRSPNAEYESFDPVDLQTEPYLQTVQLLELWLKRWHRIPDAYTRLLVNETFSVLGTHLWKLALDNEIGARIISALGDVQRLPEESRPSVRIRISVSDPTDILGTLPWEFISYPGGPNRRAFFLASDTDIVLGRWVGDATEVDIRPADKVVRVLFIMGLPDDYEFEVERRRFDNMLTQLYELKAGKGHALDIVDPVIRRWDAAQVESALRTHTAGGRQIDVVHLVAICRSDGRNGSELLQRREARRDVFQSSSTVTRTLTDAGSARPGLVVLHLSDYSGAEDEVSEHFERLAPEFIRAGIPAVLAMQYPMTEGHDVEFLQSFYQKVTNGQPIGSAVQAARRILELGVVPLNRHFGAPVLYLQSAQDGYLLTGPTGADELATGPIGIVAGNEASSARGKKVAGPMGIRERLLDWRYEASADPTTSTKVRDWIERKTWPDDTADGWRKTWQALKGRLREDEDDVNVRTAYEKLMSKVERHLESVSR